MYKELLEKRYGNIYLDQKLFEVREDVIPYYFDLIIALLEKKKVNYQKIIKETVVQGIKNVTTEILVEKVMFEDLKKEIYMFTQIACSEDPENFSLIDFKNINLALDYSYDLRNNLHEYHLIKKNKYCGYSVYHTFEQFNQDKLEKAYQKQYKSN